MNGYIALTSILIISAIVLLIALSAGLLSISELNMGLEKNQSAEAYYLASACAEQGLQEIRNSDSFTGTGSLSLENGDCSYDVSQTGGEKRTIEASGIVNNIIRKIKISLDTINPNINITSWQEVPDF
jgi:hypothetical protein